MCALPAAEVTPELRETLLTQYCTHLLTAKDYARVARVLNSPLARNGGLTASMHWLRGLAAIESKDFAEGAEQMKQCLAKRGQRALSPINKNILGAGPHHCLASCLAVLKQPDAATRAFLAALEADPKSRIVRFDFARFLAESGQEVEALKWLHQLVTDNPSDATFWLFGGQVALSKPEFLEFACDWTGEAVKIFPAHATVIEQHATALLLGGRVDEAHPLWEQLGAGTNASHRAALLICRTVLSQPLPASARETGARVNQEFINWYRRLIGAKSERVVLSVNQRLDALRRVVPGAVQLIEKALAEAGAVVGT
jgi:tetratricopeptide (TPR) repeat protein